AHAPLLDVRGGITQVCSENGTHRLPVPVVTAHTEVPIGRGGAGVWSGILCAVMCAALDRSKADSGCDVLLWRGTSGRPHDSNDGVPVDVLEREDDVVGGLVDCDGMGMG